MQLFLTSVLPFLAHNHVSAVAFLTCRHHNFHSSIIPEFLSDDERVESFYGTRQQNQLEVLNRERQYRKLFNLFVQTPLMQFSPSLVLQIESWESILKPLLATKYFTCTLQRCSLLPHSKYQQLTRDLLHALSKVRSLNELCVPSQDVQDKHLEIIISAFPRLESLTIYDAYKLKGIDTKAATNTLRRLTLHNVDSMFVTQFVPYFTNLRKLVLGAPKLVELNLHPLSSSLPLLTDLSFDRFRLDRIESLNSLVQLSALEFSSCLIPDLSFLSQENLLPELTKLCLDTCYELLTSSFASLSHAPELHVLQVVDDKFNNDCLQYLENMVHLRKLDLSFTKIVGDSRSLKTLMQNLCQLEEFNLNGCRLMGNQGAIAGALYITRSSLRVLNLRGCNLADDDLKGIDALNYTLEVLNLDQNMNLTNEALVYCQDLVKLKVLYLSGRVIDDLSPLKYCLNLEKLDVSVCYGVTSDSFKVFDEEPNSFPNLCVLRLGSYSEPMTEKVLEHLSKNNYLVYRLKELSICGVRSMLYSSASARNCICQLKGLRRLFGIPSHTRSESDRENLSYELLRSLKNLDYIF